jgi:hypothetical protein
MITREEKVASAMRDAQEMQDRHDNSSGDLTWAREWFDGNARCPCCAGTEFDIVDLNADGRMRYETFRCETGACRARWKVEFRESALSLLRDGADCEGAWIELQMFGQPNGDQPSTDDHAPRSFSEREAATILAALRYWQREGSVTAGHERDIETDFDRLKPLGAEEIDALCERINCREVGRGTS